MYIICYINANGRNVWEMVSGEDAMQIRVDELINQLKCDLEDIMVFEENNQLA